MLSKHVEIGMKVVIHSKSVGTSWIDFCSIKVPKFMVVSSTFQGKHYTLESVDHSMGNFRWGLFIAKDFEPYIEEGE